MEDRFKATIMVNGLGEFKHILIQDRNTLFDYELESSDDISNLLNELNREILEKQKTGLLDKIKEVFIVK